MSRRSLIRAGGAVLAIGFIVLFVGGGSRHIIGLVLKPMAITFVWDRSTFGVAVALFLAVSASCMFVAGHLADRYPPQRILAAGLFISAFGVGLMGVVSEPWQVFVLYGLVFAFGNGIASITPVGVMVTRRFPDYVGLSNAFVISGIGLGQLVIIAVLTTVLISYGWRSVFVWLGLINLALVPVVLWPATMAEGKTEQAVAPDVGGPSFGRAIRTRHFWLLILVYAICGFHDFFVSTHVVAFALDQGVATFLAGNLLAAMGLAGLVGVILAGTWSDRSGPVAATVCCFVLRAAMFALVLANNDAMSVTLFALAFGLTFWVTAPLTVVFVRNAFGDRHLGALSGLVTMVHHTSGGIGAFVGAALFDGGGSYDAAFAVLAVTAVLGAIATLGLLRPGPSDRQSRPA